MIGVFDSGHGGLTVLRALFDAYPEYGYIYYGDHAHAPYGEKTEEEIYSLTRRGVAYLFEQGCELVIIACNTASANALRRIQRELLVDQWSGRRVLGVLVPTVEMLTGTSWSDDIAAGEIDRSPAVVGIFATPSTVASGAYIREITSRDPRMQVIQVACSGLVPLIERNVSDERIRKSVFEYARLMHDAVASISPATNLDTVLLGCTHYGLIGQIIRGAFPENVCILHQEGIVADALGRYLKRHPEIECRLQKNHSIRCITTGDRVVIQLVSKRFFGDAFPCDWESV